MLLIKNIDELQNTKPKKAYRDGLFLSVVSTEDILPSLNTVSTEPRDCGVLSLSGVPLTTTGISVLSRGLSFVPTPRTTNEFGTFR